jgi:hypothetical protein
MKQSITNLERRMTPVMNTNQAVDQRSRATIMSELATVLGRTDASTTSIESAIAKSGVPMQEISAKFGGTRELVLAMVAQLSDLMSAPLTIDSQEASFTQRLVEFGQRVIDFYATSHLRSLYRIAVTESIRHTGLGRDFYEVGPGRLTQRLTHFLQTAQAASALRCGEPAHLLASHFLSLLRAELDETDALPHEVATNPLVRSAYVRNVVDLFCGGINGGGKPC